MGCGVDFFPILIDKALTDHIVGVAVGRQDIKGIADEEFIALGNDSNIIDRAFLAYGDRVIAADITAVFRFLTRRGSEEKAGAVLR